MVINEWTLSKVRQTVVVKDEKKKGHGTKSRVYREKSRTKTRGRSRESQEIQVVVVYSLI
jgi:hypothetical protein